MDFSKKLLEAFNGEQFRKDMLAIVESTPDESYLLDFGEEMDIQLYDFIRDLTKQVSPETRARWDEAALAAEKKSLLLQIKAAKAYAEQNLASVAKLTKEFDGLCNPQTSMETLAARRAERRAAQKDAADDEL